MTDDGTTIAAKGTAKLTKRQAECLEWVRRGYETKEIARVIGVAPDTVDMHIKNAMQRLGASSRREAARMVLPDIAETMHQSSMHHPSGMSEGGEWDQSEAPNAEEDVPAATHQAGALGWPVPRSEGQVNELGRAQRLFWVFALAFGAAVGFGIVVNSLEGLGRLI